MTFRRQCVILAIAIALIDVFCIANYSTLIPSDAYMSDANDYFRAAVHLMNDGIYSLDGSIPYSERESGYSWFLAAVFSFFGTAPWVLYGMQSAMFIAATVLWMREVRHWSGDRTAVLAGWLLGSIPGVHHSLLVPLREGVVLIQLPAASKETFTDQ